MLKVSSFVLYDVFVTCVGVDVCLSLYVLSYGEVVQGCVTSVSMRAHVCSVVRSSRGVRMKMLKLLYVFHPVCMVSKMKYNSVLLVLVCGSAENRSEMIFKVWLT